MPRAPCSRPLPKGGLTIHRFLWSNAFSEDTRPRRSYPQRQPPLEVSVNHPPARPNWWRWPTFALWMLFFLAGLFPEWVFRELRQAGAVTTQDAYINSHHMITLGLTGYLIYFLYQRGREAGLDTISARGKALQAGIVALVAFLPIQLEQAGQFRNIPVAHLRHLILFVAVTKVACWGYLLALLLRYYFRSGDRVFLEMPLLFPSAHLHHQAGNTSRDKQIHEERPDFSPLEPDAVPCSRRSRDKKAADENT